MVAFRSIFSIAALVSAVSAIPNSFEKRTVATVEKDIATITADVCLFFFHCSFWIWHYVQVKALDKALVALPSKNATITQALKIHIDAETLLIAILTAAKDASTVKNVTESDAKKVCCS